ncbi:uncharacterized protein YukE [Streptomyces sp. Amel2xB2]|uniref:PE domain-containing protein n=1 Tax=Streptomyces nanshensis TaxID=518642 RepID=A0A1E7KXZ5_9ACTN|nr:MULTISPECIES: type VII secretion target [Streptomyces]OEV08809.1 hypothetical protein AN218_24915 [Streptomyces nanshensis]RAJ66775.1 uncharacterized protein YukE [Streptomyces sp. Amel2xB2]
MSGFHIDPGEMAKFAKSFEQRAQELGEALAKFKPKTDAEAIHDGFGIMTESEEVTSAYIELSGDMEKTVEGLQKHLDKIADGIKQNAKNTEAADEALSGIFKAK